MIGKLILGIIIICAIIVYVRPDLADLMLVAVMDFAMLLGTVCLVAVIGIIAVIIIVLFLIFL